MVNIGILSLSLFLVFFCFVLSFMAPRKRDLSDYEPWARSGLTETGLIKSNKCREGHPSVVTLFVANWDTKLINLFNDIKKEFDSKTYKFGVTSDPQLIKDWKIDKLPTLRAYGPDGMCDPELFSELSGEFNRTNIRNFLQSQ